MLDNPYSKVELTRFGGQVTSAVRDSVAERTLLPRQSRYVKRMVRGADHLRAAETASRTGRCSRAAGDMHAGPPRPSAMEGRSRGYPQRVYPPPPLAWAVAGRYGARSDGDQLVDRESTLNDGVGRRGSLVSPRWPHSCCRLALVVLEGGRRLVAQRRVAAAPVVQPNDIAPTVPAFPRSVRLSTLGILGLGGSSESIT